MCDVNMNDWDGEQNTAQLVEKWHDICADCIVYNNFGKANFLIEKHVKFLLNITAVSGCRNVLKVPQAISLSLFPQMFAKWEWRCT